MLVSGANQIHGVSATPPDSDNAISLSERMSALQSDAVGANTSVVPAGGDDPSIDPTLDYDLEEIYQWLMANRELMVDDPKLLIDGIISKLKRLTRSDGSLTYKSFSEISNACTMLKKRCEDTGNENDDFFNKLTGTVFGLNIFSNQLRNQIFFNTDNDSSKGKFF